MGRWPIGVANRADCRNWRPNAPAAATRAGSRWQARAC